MNSCGARETKKRHDFEYRKYFGTYTSSVIFHGRSGGGERRVEYENVSRKYENYKNSCIISIQNNKTTYEMANKTVSRVLRMPDIILRIMSSCIYFVGFCRSYGHCYNDAKYRANRIHFILRMIYQKRAISLNYVFTQFGVDRYVTLSETPL